MAAQFPDTAENLESGLWRVPVSISRGISALAGQPSAEDFELLADCLPTLCWMARGDGYITWYNRRWHDYCGSTPAAMEGWGWQSVHAPEELPRVMAAWTRSIAEGQPFEMTFPLRGRDGVFRPFLTRIVPLRDGSGEVKRWFGVNTEVTTLMAVQAALAESEQKYDLLTNAMPQMVWSTLPDGFHDYYNAQWYEFTGVPFGSTDGEGWNDMFHPEDQDRAWTRWRHSLTTGEPYEIEYRLRHRSGEYRWTLGRAMPMRDAEGNIVRWIGTCTDIHEAKRAAEQNELLNKELSHRIKNIFSIIAGLIGLSARTAPESKPFAKQLSDRIAALGRAHEFARPHSEKSRPEFGVTTLHGLLSELFEPYAVGGISRIALVGDDAPIDDKGATPIALVFHELATNAAKYGALSVGEGRVTVDIKMAGEQIDLTWIETGGPMLAGPPHHEGFGTRLASLSVQQQLGGEISRDWKREGLVVRLTLKRTSLVRGGVEEG